MLKSSLVIKSAGAAIEISSQNKKDIVKLKKSTFLKRYIPDGQIVTDMVMDQKKVDCRLVLHGGSEKLKLNYPQADYYTKKYNEKDIVSLAEYLLERARQERGIFCVHGSACVVNDQAIIFWGGASGMGKTSLSHDLGRKQWAKWYGDEKILIDLRRKTVCGRVATAYIKNGQKNIYQSIIGNFSPSIPIAFFVYPFLFKNSNDRLTWVRWPKEKFYWHLFEELNRKIRATSRRLFNNQEPIMPIDTIELARRRNVLIRGLIKTIPCYYTVGNSHLICGKIKSLIK
ncbi:MAG: hypothetical protein WCT16_01480 [Candidatus Buchananbacteria bacterium]